MLRPDQVAALFIPAQSHTIGAYKDCVTIAGALITGAVFLGLELPPYGVMGAVPLGLVGVAMFGVCGFADDAVNYTPAEVLCLRPGQQLPYPLE